VYEVRSLTLAVLTVARDGDSEGRGLLAATPGVGADVQPAPLAERQPGPPANYLFFDVRRGWDVRAAGPGWADARLQGVTIGEPELAFGLGLDNAALPQPAGPQGELPEQPALPGLPDSTVVLDLGLAQDGHAVKVEGEEVAAHKILVPMMLIKSMPEKDVGALDNAPSLPGSVD
jgi:hypothetical protein